MNTDYHRFSPRGVFNRQDAEDAKILTVENTKTINRKKRKICEKPAKTETGKILLKNCSLISRGSRLIKFGHRCALCGKGFSRLNGWRPFCCNPTGEEYFALVL
jgi:hypothetical protein